MDCLSIFPGEQWKPRIREEIKNREIFFLFWSENAKKSKWVEWEWRTALEYKNLSGIYPRPLIGVPQADPPEELSDLHFSDPLIG
jgi:hypothetical protein